MDKLSKTPFMRYYVKHSNICLNLWVEGSKGVILCNRLARVTISKSMSYSESEPYLTLERSWRKSRSCALADFISYRWGIVTVTVPALQFTTRKSKLPRIMPLFEDQTWSFWRGRLIAREKKIVIFCWVEPNSKWNIIPKYRLLIIIRLYKHFHVGAERNMTLKVSFSTTVGSGQSKWAN